MDDMGLVAKACGCPLYWKGPLFYGAGGERTGSVSVHKFVAMWRKILQNCHDDAAKFVHLLMSPGCNYLVQEDFVPFLQDVVNTHPGLSFLKEASEFHSRYITTVIQRIFYAVNRSWSGRITCAELRRSSFLQNVALLEEEADINQLTEFFSYEHFYVIYCKFWELDTDHDLLIDADDLARHNDHGAWGHRGGRAARTPSTPFSQGLRVCSCLSFRTPRSVSAAASPSHSPLCVCSCLSFPSRCPVSGSPCAPLPEASAWGRLQGQCGPLVLKLLARGPAALWGFLVNTRARAGRPHAFPQELQVPAPKAWSSFHPIPG
uniref:cDNA FLJ60425, highly similar to Serine/threonine-protein phosphatase 2A 48 kDa regulatory subunit B n=1 Tax=Homo sapiens TaxID=9606 RepID=B4DE79_HUMAN|nr:unnamed protein product [Homo sapiens]